MTFTAFGGIHVPRSIAGEAFHYLVFHAHRQDREVASAVQYSQFRKSITITVHHDAAKTGVPMLAEHGAHLWTGFRRQGNRR